MKSQEQKRKKSKKFLPPGITTGCRSRWRAKDGRELPVLCNYTTEPRTAVWHDRSFLLEPMEYQAIPLPSGGEEV